MLDSISKKVLRIVLNLCRNNQFIEIEDIQELLPLPEDEIEECVSHLIDSGYLKGICLDTTIAHIQPTYKGKTFAELEKKSFFEYVLKNILVPVMIGVLSYIASKLIDKWLL